MRWIDKSGPAPAALAAFLAVQRPVGVNLDYQSFNRKAELRRELAAQQHGLCALTGAAIDERLASEASASADAGAPVKIKPHNAHLKPRTICEREMIARGEEPGRAVGEDMDYHNLVAALLVEGAQCEMFGAAAQADQLLRLKPTDPACESRLRFDGNGGVQGLDGDASATVAVLRLGHRTLAGWRREAIEVFTDPAVIRSRADRDAVIARMSNPVNGSLPAYCFAIQQVVLRLWP